MNIPLNKAPFTLARKLNWKSVLFLKTMQFTIKFQLNRLGFQADKTCTALSETSWGMSFLPSDIRYPSHEQLSNVVSCPN